MSSRTTLIDSNANVLERYRYSAFGTATVLNPDYSVRGTSYYDWDILFHGEMIDLNTDWYNYGYRWYLSYLGRWPSRDPIANAELSQGASLYWFVQNNAIDGEDENGMAAALLCVVGIAASPIEVPATAVIVTVVAIGGIGYFIWRACKSSTSTDEDDSEKCLPCIPPVGTIAYRVNLTGRSHGGVPTPHSHQYTMSQSPPPAGCKCFWNDGPTLPGVYGPPISLALGGGIAP